MFNKIIFVVGVLLWGFCFSLCADMVEEEPSLPPPPSRIVNDYVLIVNCHLETINWQYNYEDEIIRYIGLQEDLNIYTEHIKTLDITDMQMLDEKCNELLRKYDKRPEAIVFIGPAPFSLFAPAFNRQWKDVPMLSLGPKKRQPTREEIIYQQNVPFDRMEVVDAAAMQKKYNVTGIWTHFYIRETLDLMMRTIRGMNHLVWIGDNRQGSIVARMQAKAELLKYFPELTVDYISPRDMNTNALLKKVASYDQRTGILFHTWYMQGNNSEEYYLSNNLYKTLCGFASTPVFSLWDMNTEMGYIAGGHFVRMSDMSTVAVGLLKRILAGEQARSIPFQELSGDKDYLNYTCLNSFHSNPKIRNYHPIHD